MEKIRAFLRKKDVVISAQRYGIDALSAMAQGLFCTLLVGTILNTLGTQFHIGFLEEVLVTVGKDEAAVYYRMGDLASAMVGPAMAAAIGFALKAPPMVLFSLIPVGFATNALGGAGGPLAVLFVAIFASECGKLVSKETKVDILVTPGVTIGFGAFLSTVIDFVLVALIIFLMIKVFNTARELAEAKLLKKTEEVEEVVEEVPPAPTSEELLAEILAEIKKK